MAGKRTLAVRLGDQRTRLLYALLMAIPFLVLPLVAGLSGRPAARLGLRGAPLATRPLVTVLSGATGPSLIPVLAKTALVELVYGVLLAVGLLFVL